MALAPLARGPRQETAVVELGGEIYVLGGFDASRRMRRTVEAYDPGQDRWRDIADLPEDLHHANAAAVGGRLYVLGFLSGGFAEVGRAFVYDPSLDAWSPLAPLPAGRERGASAVAVHGGVIYLIGGLRGLTSVPLADAYDPEIAEWRELPPLPRPSDHVVAGTLGEVLVVAGGRSGGIGGFTAQVDVFDPRAGRWTAGPAMPTGRGGSAAAVLEGRLYVFGGEGSPRTATGVFAEAEVYDPSLGRWLGLAPMRTPRHGTGAAALGGRVYVPGGADVQAFAAVDAHEAFEPAP